MDSKKIDIIFTKLHEAIPNPITELEFRNHFTLLVAIILSAQANDKSVNKATKDLFLKVDDPQKMLELGEEGLKFYIKTIGLYNSKAKNIIKLSEILVSKYNSQIPRDRDELQTLPGIGRKTANVFLNCAFHEPLIAVDTHVFRVTMRLGLASGKNVMQTEKELEYVIPEKWKVLCHHLLILHGRYTCTAKKPHCLECPVYEYCEWPQKTLRPS